MELGRSARLPMRLLPAAGSATGSSTTDREFRSSDRGGACSRSRSAAAAASLNDQQNSEELALIIALTRADNRETRRPLAGPPLPQRFYNRARYQRTAPRQRLDCAGTL